MTYQQERSDIFLPLGINIDEKFAQSLAEDTEFGSENKSLQQIIINNFNNTVDTQPNPDEYLAKHQAALLALINLYDKYKLTIRYNYLLTSEYVHLFMLKKSVNNPQDSFVGPSSWTDCFKEFMTHCYKCGQSKFDFTQLMPREEESRRPLLTWLHGMFSGSSNPVYEQLVANLEKLEPTQLIHSFEKIVNSNKSNVFIRAHIFVLLTQSRGFYSTGLDQFMKNHAKKLIDNILRSQTDASITLDALYLLLLKDVYGKKAIEDRYKPEHTEVTTSLLTDGPHETQEYLAIESWDSAVKFSEMYPFLEVLTAIEEQVENNQVLKENYDALVTFMYDYLRIKLPPRILPDTPQITNG